MIPKRGATSRGWLIASLILCAAAASGQSKFVAAIDRFRATGNQAFFNQEVFSVIPDCDLRVEVPALLNLASSSDDAVIRDLARGMVYSLAVQRRTDGDLFRAAVPIVERCLPDEPDSNRKTTDRCEIEVVMLEAIFGFAPTPRTLALMYKMVDYKYDSWAQGLAFEALASLRPIPPEAKELFKSRMLKTEGMVSGAELLPHLAPGLSDWDILQMFLASAESQDVKEQRMATRGLANMNPIPPQVAELFRRLQLRADLDDRVAANVRGALNRIDHAPPHP